MAQTEEQPRLRNLLAEHWLLLALAPGSLLLILLLSAPIPQDPAYHLFADTRSFMSIPNALDILSNLPFMLVGGYGLWICRSCHAGAAWVTLFAGVTLVAAGSAYYHAVPDNETLVWDRLPMTIGFMGLFAALLTEYVHWSLRHLLVPAVTIGIASIGVWVWTGDLRVYAWVQFMPLLTLPVLIWRYDASHTHQHLLFWGLGAYLSAKVSEHFDTEVYALTGSLVSGHSLKHLLAAASVLLIAEMLRRRTVMPTST